MSSRFVSLQRLLVRNFQNSAIKCRIPPEHQTKLYKKNPAPHHKVLTINEFVEATDASYPPIKDKYPPGQWGSTDPQFAWKIHELSAALDALPTLTARLDHLSLVEKNLWYHKINLPFSIPINIDFVQYITDSLLLHNQLPNHLDNFLSESSSSNAVLQNEIDKLKSLSSTGAERAKSIWFKNDKNALRRERESRIIEFMDTIYGSCIANNSDHHLSTAHVDENSHVECFFKRTGYEELGEAREDRHRYDFNPLTYVPPVWECHVDRTIRDEDGLVKFTVRAPLIWKMRSSEILKPWSHETIDVDGVPEYNVHPELFQIKPKDHYACQNYPLHKNCYSDTFLRNIPGYWSGNMFHPGDPRAHGIVGVLDAGQVLNSLEEEMKSQGGFEITPDLLREQLLSEGILTAFAWCYSQAFNRGFHLYRELDGPISCQLLLTDGRDICILLAYQLNSMTRLWKAKDTQLPNNVAWYRDLSGKDSLHSPQVANVLQQMILAPTMKDEKVAEIWRDFIEPDPQDEADGLDRWRSGNPQRIYSLARPHPNRMFYFEETKKEDVMRDLRSTVTKSTVGLLPEPYQKRGQEFRLRRKLCKEGRVKTLRPPMRWE